MLRTSATRKITSNLIWTRSYVSDPFNSSKPTSEKHATEKSDKSLNAQSDAVEKGMKDKQGTTASQGKKEQPEKTTKAPGP